MKNNKLRACMTRMLAVRELRLAGHGRNLLGEGVAGFMRDEAESLRESLTRLELFDEARLANMKEKILLDWSDSDADAAAEGVAL